MNRIGDFYRGDSLDIEAVVLVDGQPEDLTGAQVWLTLKAPHLLDESDDQAALQVIHVVGESPADEPAAGKAVLRISPAATANIAPGKYVAGLKRVFPVPARVFTFHVEELTVRQAPSVGL